MTLAVWSPSLLVPPRIFPPLPAPARPQIGPPPRRGPLVGGQVIELDQGQAVAFASSLRHAGHRITAGRRYVLVGFLLAAGRVEHDRRLLESAQTLRALGRPDAAERRCRQALEVNPRRQVGGGRRREIVCESDGTGGRGRGWRESLRRDCPPQPPMPVSFVSMGDLSFSMGGLSFSMGGRSFSMGGLAFSMGDLSRGSGSLLREPRRCRSTVGEACKTSASASSSARGRPAAAEAGGYIVRIRPAAENSGAADPNRRDFASARRRPGTTWASSSARPAGLRRPPTPSAPPWL